MNADFVQALTLVDSYYQNAFASLLQLTIAIIGFSAILLPLILSFFQARALKSENKALRDELKLHADQSLNQLKVVLQAEIEEKLQVNIAELKQQLLESEQKLARSASTAHGGVYFVQARGLVLRKHYSAASKSYAIAAAHFLEAHDFVNLRKSIDQLIEDSLSKISSKNNSSFQTVPESVNTLIVRMRSHECFPHYADRVASLEKALKSASEKAIETEDA